MTAIRAAFKAYRMHQVLIAHAHHFRIVWPTHQLSLMLVSNICHSPFRKFMLAEWLAAMFLLNCGKKE